MPRRRVIIDVDGVLRDFIGSLTRVYQREFPGQQVLPVTSRRLEDFFPIGGGIYDFMDRRHVEEIMEEADAYPGAVESLQRWQAVYDIIVATAQPPLGWFPTLIWLGRHKVPCREVHLIQEKERLVADAMLDDFVENLVNFAAGGRLAVCLEQPWNRDWQGPRVASVGEFFTFIEDYFRAEEATGGQLLA